MRMRERDLSWSSWGYIYTVPLSELGGRNGLEEIRNWHVLGLRSPSSTIHTHTPHTLVCFSPRGFLPTHSRSSYPFFRLSFASPPSLRLLSYPLVAPQGPSDGLVLPGDESRQAYRKLSHTFCTDSFRCLQVEGAAMPWCSLSYAPHFSSYIGLSFRFYF